jgi:hypothetical protein
MDAARLNSPWRDLRLYWIVAFLALLVSCSNRESSSAASGLSMYPPPSFEESDLTGVWAQRPEGIYDQEVVTINANHTFAQTYDTENGFRVETEGTWWLERSDSGCTYIHLEGMWYYHSTSLPGEESDASARFSTRVADPCQDRTIQMDNEVILLIAEYDNFPEDLRLQYLLDTVWATDKLLALRSN